MESNKQIANRLREVLIDGKWIANVNYQELIADLTWEESIMTVGEHNSIALLIFHVDYYLGGLLEAFETGHLTIRDKFSFEMPEIKSQSNWRGLVDRFTKNAVAFVKAVESFSPEKIESPFIEEKYGSYRKNLEGVIEHSYYHMGQISLIKKLIRNQTQA